MMWGTGKCEICSANPEILPGVNIAVLSPKVILPFLGPSVFSVKVFSGLDEAY